MAMKKWILLLCVSVSLTSCSYLTDFYIFNTSEETITITYKTIKTEANHPFVTAPKIFHFKNLKKIGKKKIENAAIQLKDSLTVIATLEPKQALWIGVDRTFILKNEREQLRGNLEFITITQGRVTKKLTTKDVLPQFQEFTSEIVGIVVE